MTVTELKVTANGQISIPAAVRRRWKTDRVIAIDTPHGLVIRPYDPNPVRRIAGKYERRGPSIDEARQAAREEDAEREAARDARRVARDRA